MQTKVYVPGRPSLSWRDFGPQHLFLSFWNYRKLVLQLTRREIAARYRGSVLGLAWSFFTPLFMLAIYTFVFTVVFAVRWEVAVGNKVEFALVLFAGLTIFQLFSECVARAPGLLLENPAYIKKVIFPLEIMGWVSLLSAFFNAAIGLGILLMGYILVVGVPPVTLIWTPLVLAPFMLLLLGLTWFLAPLGLYVRDVRQAIGVILPVFMFASPIFYPISAVPESARWAMHLNPLCFIIEQLRDVALFGNQPNVLGLVTYATAALFVAWAGLVFFLITKRGFADVI